MAYSITALKMWALSGGFSAADASTAAAVAMAESSGNREAVSSVGALGLWQIMPRTAEGVGQKGTKAYLFNPLYNATTAAKIKKRYGWNQWDAYKNESYRKYLPEAEKADPPGDPKPSEELFDNPVQGLEDVGAASRDIVRAGQWIANPTNILRVVYVVAGGVLIIAGASALAKPVIDPVIKETRGAVKGFVTKGKAGKAK